MSARGRFTRQAQMLFSFSLVWITKASTCVADIIEFIQEDIIENFPIVLP
jgi:hypothetical protein